MERYDEPIGSLTFYPFGFVSGCIWGDDSSWKIQFLDLTQAEKGIVKREERFGYIELPSRLSLPEAIDMYYFDDKKEDASLNIYVMKRFRFSSGKEIDPLS